ncbi:hypothetical protein ABE10_31505 [Bacillus toyonensis]|nr:hypothetical protein [Bacillus toyonensis]
MPLNQPLLVGAWNAIAACLTPVGSAIDEVHVPMESSAVRPAKSSVRNHCVGVVEVGVGSARVAAVALTFTTFDAIDAPWAVLA